MARRSAAKTMLVLLVVSLALVAFVASPASAGPRLNCVMNGAVDIVPNPDAGFDWTVGAGGPCGDDLRGPFLGVVSGQGHSDTLGLCGSLLVQNLAIDVTFSFNNIRTGEVRTVTERWQAGLTTFPVVTPFLIGNGESGLGVIVTRILLACPPAGNHGATFVFTTST